MWTHVDVFGRGSLVREREQARASAVSELVAVLSFTFFICNLDTPLRLHGIRFSERVPRRDFAQPLLAWSST